MRYTFPAQSDARLMTAVLTRLARPMGWFTGAGMLAVAGVTAVVSDRGLAIVFVGFAVLIVVFLPGRVARQAVRQQSAQIGTPVTYQLDDQGIRTLGGFRENFRPWAAVTAVEEWKGQIAVVLGWRSIWGIPTGGMSADPARHRADHPAFPRHGHAGRRRGLGTLGPVSRCRQGGGCAWSRRGASWR
jgi:hypothetical protein